jgi:hypothetical protein
MRRARNKLQMAGAGQRRWGVFGDVARTWGRKGRPIGRGRGGGTKPHETKPRRGLGNSSALLRKRDGNGKGGVATSEREPACQRQCQQPVAHSSHGSGRHMEACGHPGGERKRTDLLKAKWCDAVLVESFGFSSPVAVW